jgi:uncharacterized membrane protein YkoI
MLRSKLVPIAIAAAIALDGAASAVYAAKNEHGGERRGAHEIATILNAKTSLTQAIAVAEQQSGGKAIDAGVENENGATAFAVEVAKDNTIQKVLVDVQTGNVLKVVAADKEEDENDEQDND